MTIDKTAEALWDLLDDIDTASDMFKPSNEIGYRKFYNYTMRKVAKRHELLKSNGYALFLPGDIPKRSSKSDRDSPMKRNASS